MNDNVTKLLVEQEGYHNIHIYVYPTIRSVYEAYFHGDLNKYIEAFSDGELVKTPIDEAIKNGENYDCWGFEEDKKSLHIWFNPNIELTRLISLLAHEIGHLTRPHHQSPRKEQEKAQQYQDVTDFATSLANKILKRDYLKHNHLDYNPLDAVGEIDKCKAVVSYNK